MSSRGGSDNDRRGDLGLFSHSRTCRDSDLIRESKTKKRHIIWILGLNPRMTEKKQPENDRKKESENDVKK